MDALSQWCPRGAPWRVPWDALATIDWVDRMRGCPQDPVHHAEGDVFVHTRLVLE